MIGVIIAVAVTAVVVAPVSWILSRVYNKKVYESKVGTAEEKAREIIDRAVETAEEKKRIALIEAKDESIKNKNEIEREAREHRSEVQRYEKRVLAKEEALEKKSDQLDKRESNIQRKESEIEKIRAKVDNLNNQRIQELERISGLTSEQAKEHLLETVRDDVKGDEARIIMEAEARAKDEADRRAKEIVVNSIQRCAVDYVSEATVSVVPIPSDDMKGRIIGREGRNVRTFENAADVELIIDDTPDAIVVSSFDPVKREVARIALEKLFADGRIQPARIEETLARAGKEVDKKIKEEGEAAVLETKVHGLHPELVKLLGSLKYRSSYGQNVLKHSIEVSILSGLIAAEVGVDVRLARRAGLLHDIGKALNYKKEGTHAELGAQACRKCKESETVVNAVEAHHGETEPKTLIACIVQAADAISAARPGARKETLTSYTNRLKQLEDIANSFDGVDKSYVFQAGREVRVMVVPEKVSDADMVIMARDISNQIHEQMNYPGQIKVNVIRETRVAEIAK